MQFETLQDPIEVQVHFGHLGMRPVWFTWQGKRRAIREVTYAWSERDGALLHRCFSVTDGVELYELRFDAAALRWQLTKIAVDG